MVRKFGMKSSLKPINFLRQSKIIEDNILSTIMESLGAG